MPLGPELLLRQVGHACISHRALFVGQGRRMRERHKAGAVTLFRRSSLLQLYVTELARCEGSLLRCHTAA